MITYQAIQTSANTWGVEWYVDGKRQGFVWGSWNATEGEALAAVVAFIQLDFNGEAVPLPCANHRFRLLPRGSRRRGA